MSFIGKKFPDIYVDATDNTGEYFKINILEEATKNNKKVLLFWYPKDFTFVCPTELHAFEEALSEFKKRNTLVIGASCDTAEVHFAWLMTSKKNGGIEGVSYPILADTNRNLSNILDILDIVEREYDVNGNKIIEGSNVTYRATYLIDEQGTVFHEGINHMTLGRNVMDYIRLIDAYTQVQKHGEVCPANWQEGHKSMSADIKGVKDYFK